jgi:hypothetical protein
MQAAKGFFDIGVNPRIATVILRFCTCGDDPLKCPIGGNGKAALPYCFSE